MHNNVYIESFHPVLKKECIYMYTGLQGSPKGSL